MRGGIWVGGDGGDSYPVELRKLRAVKVRDLIRLIETDGWKHVRTTGSHRHFKHDTKPSVVTVSGRPGDDLPTGTLMAILRAAGLEDKR
jgi:predicted RNA binding protein YcfA (HicA-like mRNA interferase family)